MYSAYGLRHWREHGPIPGGVADGGRAARGGGRRSITVDHGRVNGARRVPGTCGIFNKLGPGGATNRAGRKSSRDVQSTVGQRKRGAETLGSAGRRGTETAKSSGRFRTEAPRNNRHRDTEAHRNTGCDGAEAAFGAHAGGPVACKHTPVQP